MPLLRTIDAGPLAMNNSTVSAELRESDEVLEAYLDLLASGQKDDELLARARARADEICKEMKARYGHRKIAAKLIREARGD